jgi:hypothetical protein
MGNDQDNAGRWQLEARVPPRRRGDAERRRREEEILSRVLFDADLIISTDDSLLTLDGVLIDGSGKPIAYRDTDGAFALL